jgi:hypothetical protein
LGTQLGHDSSYHPQYDGQTEIMNKCLEGYLHFFAYDKHTNGPSGFPWKNVGTTHPSILDKKCPHLWISSFIHHITLEWDYKSSRSG